MKILLVFPRAEYVPGRKRKGIEPITSLIGEAISLTLPQVAACTPKGHEVTIIDENYEKLNFKEDYDLVGITCLTMNAPRAYEIADRFRSMGIPVVLGGPHPSALPEEAKQHADAVVIGEAELTWPQLLEDFEKGELKPFYKADKPIPPDIIPEPRRDLIKRKYFIDALLVKRGCPNRCEFCMVTSIFNREIKPIEKVLEEINNISTRDVCIYDQNLTWNMSYTKELLRRLKETNKRWLANGTVNVLGRDDEFLRLAKEANIYYWYIGFESISQKSLDGANKKHNRVEEYESTIKKIKEHGMIINASFIFGFDEDTPDIFDATIKTIEKWDIDMAEFHILTPFPGTRLYDRLKKEGRILTEEWDKYTTATVVFQPKNMSPQELFEGTRKVAKSFYTIPKIIKRTIKAFKVTKDLSIALFVLLRNLRYRERYKRQFNF